uniref:Nicotianamine synthase n=1 Tax=Leersia perrieri TaxID=77586 RepID=A0A0D9X365_9ORYZ
MEIMAMAAPEQEKKHQQQHEESDESIQKLVEKITGLATAIGKLPSLTPSPSVNALFTELVTTCIPPSRVDVDRHLSPEAQQMRRRLILLCGDAEGHLEAHYSDLLAGHENPLEHLPLFPYFNNYLELSKLEHGLLARHVSPSPSRVAFLGSGPLPLTSIVLASRHLTESSFVNYDVNGDANGRARRLLRGDAALASRMEFVTADVNGVDGGEIASYDAVFLAALVGMTAAEKARVVERLGRHMAEGAALVVRSAHGARGFLYPVVDPEEIRRGGFDVLAVHHPEGEVINSVIIARKPPVTEADGGGEHAHGHGAVVSMACQRCEMEARAHQKMEEMVAVEKLPAASS